MDRLREKDTGWGELAHPVEIGFARNCAASIVIRLNIVAESVFSEKGKEGSFLPAETGFPHIRPSGIVADV